MAGKRRTRAEVIPGRAPVLVTGGAGFIGSHLVRRLLAQGQSVRVLDDFSTGKEENLHGVEALGAQCGAFFQVVEGDVRDDIGVRSALEGCSAVAHLAAIASVTRSVEDPVGANSVTHGGTVNIVRRSVEQGLSRVVLASSCAIYGDAVGLPIPETTSPRPLSPYAAAKLASEGVCISAADAGQLSSVCLRFFNVYGPRQDPSSEYSGVISRFMSAAAGGEGVTIFGDGEQTRDFVYVGDIADALAQALTLPLSGAVVANLGTGRQTSLLGILAQLELLCARAIDRQFRPPRPGDIRHSCADAGQAGRLLGWEAHTTFPEGLRLTYDWYSRRYGVAAGTR